MKSFQQNSSLTLFHFALWWERSIWFRSEIEITDNSLFAAKLNIWKFISISHSSISINIGANPSKISIGRAAISIFLADIHPSWSESSKENISANFLIFSSSTIIFDFSFVLNYFVFSKTFFLLLEIKFLIFLFFEPISG